MLQKTDVLMLHYSVPCSDRLPMFSFLHRVRPLPGGINENLLITMFGHLLAIVFMDVTKPSDTEAKGNENWTADYIVLGVDPAVGGLFRRRHAS
jgi:hypothetical protein